MNRLLYSLILIGLFACDENRIFEDNYRLTEKYWHVDTVASFTFDINEPNENMTSLSIFGTLQLTPITICMSIHLEIRRMSY